MISHMKRFVVPSCLLAGLVAISTLSAEVIDSEKARFRVEVLADGLQQPWGIAELPGGDLLVTEKSGRLRMIRGRIKSGAWVDEENIFQAPESESTSRGVHFGNRMDFGPDGMLYFTIGDRGSRPDPSNFAQKLDNAAGKCHRIHDERRIPDDNPFAGQAGAMASIWTYGNRNIQGLRFHPTTGLLWSTEHGPRGGDEVNILRKGQNYGWPVVTYGINYNGTPISDKAEAPGMEPPVLQWTPSIAVAGIDFYFGDQFPKWKGNLFATALAHQKLVRMEIEDNKITHQEILMERTGRMRDVLAASDGSLLVVYDNPGKIVRMVPAT